MALNALLSSVQIAVGSVKNPFFIRHFSNSSPFFAKKDWISVSSIQSFDRKCPFSFVQFFVQIIRKAPLFGLMYDIKYNFLFFILHNFDYFHIYICQTFMRKFHQVFGCVFYRSADDTVSCLYNAVIHCIQCRINCFACAD